MARSCGRRLSALALQSVDFSQASGMPGVIAVFQDGGFAGLVAQTHDQAQAAIQAVQATWLRGNRARFRRGWGRQVGKTTKVLNGQEWIESLRKAQGLAPQYQPAR